MRASPGPAGRGAVRGGRGAGSGTPLQNDLGELQSLLSFLLPDVFGADGQLMDGLEEVPAANPKTPNLHKSRHSHCWQRVCMCLHFATPIHLGRVPSLASSCDCAEVVGGRQPSQIVNSSRFIPELARFHAKRMLRWRRHLRRRLRGILGL